MAIEDIKNDIAYQGTLYINAEAGTITFMTTEGRRLLRVTHLDTIPVNVRIDIVAIQQVTSYTPINPIDMSDIDGSEEIMQELGPE